jgi:DNA repair photolyase
MYSICMADSPQDRERYSGRGALSNPQPRFLRNGSERFDDGWYQDEVAASIATQVRPEPARSIISHNDSPDIPFEQSINPYRGCEHGCPYCVGPDTPILMSDGSTRPIADLHVGDSIYGTTRNGWYRRYVRTTVLAHWSVIKPAYRITLEDGTGLIASGDHRFLTERGWKHVTGTEQGPLCRPHLTINNKLMGVGQFAKAPEHDEDYRRGYLCGLIRGDGTIGRDLRGSDGIGRVHQYFRLALCDDEALQRAQTWLLRADVTTSRFQFCAGSDTRRPLQAISAGGHRRVDRIRELTWWPHPASRSWRIGFLAGIFDAEGCYSGGTIRISNSDEQIISHIKNSLTTLDFEFIIEPQLHYVNKPIQIVRVLGGLREHLRFFHTVDPAIMRKRDIAGQAIKSDAKLKVMSIEPLPGAMRLFDISTGTEDFIANGVVSHNCYARPSHAYLDLSPGIDFETKIFYKADAARLLEQELSKRSYVVKPITIGANTDPYQPIERELRVTRSLLEVLERTRHPVSLITKGSMILRDLDLLTSLSRDGLVNVFVSITTLDPELKRTLEPRAASPAARLRVVRELSAAGVPTGVFAAPMIPAVNDSELERIVAAAAAAGAFRAGYVLLRLPHELKQIFRQWLDEHLPERAEHVMSLIRGARDGLENDPRFGSRMRGSGPWAQLLKDRFALACKRHGLTASRERELSCAHFRPPGAGGQMSLGI